MKTVVLLNDLTMADVVGSSYYKKYLEYLSQDIQNYLLKDPSSLKEVLCPGCGNSNTPNAYVRMGMNFKACPECGSFFVSPRPSSEALEHFYKNSAACQYWRKQISELPDSQLHYIYGSRISWILESVDEFLKDSPFLLDFETKYPSLFKHLLDEKIFQSMSTLNPQLFEQIGLLPKDILVRYNTQDYVGKVNILTAFESLERMSDPDQFFKLAGQCCQKDGLLLITTSTSSGFEYQILGENAPNINPINRMNLLSLEALTQKVQNAGFEIVELSTPGRLDVEIVRRAVEENKNLKIDPFWKYIFESREEKTWQNLQDFLQANRLSSHLRIAARKM